MVKKQRRAKAGLWKRCFLLFKKKQQSGFLSRVQLFVHLAPDFYNG